MDTFVISFTPILIGLQALLFLLLLWLGWRYYDRRYKSGKQPQNGLYDGTLERTSEVFIDPKDGLRYRVYFNRHTGEREYIRED
ncbi:HD family phosphohydrolase [Xylanibacillus composti]|uniref:HD family phosphohydrolase n=1 Tax=Xylanibacillus composti TaxID=1572762 RepID=A0A8J4H721_9BACL|nr:HD family phosphohydrolase [Xylanibacillus composti]MDT9724647.1 HD family phosphohydrolase [Xylanibacillus composti]GIQ70932.1 hypothetical protein XYCOK13_37560 [Xylanibacillus composti]